MIHVIDISLAEFNLRMLNERKKEESKKKEKQTDYSDFKRIFDSQFVKDNLIEVAK